MWQTELGVTVNLNNQDWNVFLQNRKDGNYQIARNGWIADYNDPCSFLDMWYTDGGNNDAQYSNPDYDAAIDAAKATSDPEERMKAFHEAEAVSYTHLVSMSVGVFAAILVLVIGALYGAISGYCGGKVDAVMQRIVELIYAVPEMLVVLLIATALKPILTDYVNSSGTSPLKSFVNVLGPNLISMFIAFGLLYWVTMSRIIRGQVLQLKQQEYVTAARALGASGGRIIRRHLLPNCIGQIVVTTCLQIPSAIFLESFLSYLGVGVSAPLPSLGSMATDALSGMYTYTYRPVSYTHLDVYKRQ